VVVARLIGSILIAWAAANPAFAQKAYDWVGDHACVVESSTGLLGFPSSTQIQTFRWTNFDKSFFIQIRECSKAPLEWEYECDTARATEQQIKTAQGMKMSARSRDEFPVGWRSRFLTSFPFVTATGESFGTDSKGRFVYSSNGFTSDKELAVFMAAGTCSPFTR
jgi:hypothetical protein